MLEIPFFRHFCLSFHLFSVLIRVYQCQKSNLFPASRNRALHLSRELYKSTLILTNKPNFQKPKKPLTPYLTTNYEDLDPPGRAKNKPNSNPIQTQFKPNFPNRKSEIANRKSLDPIQTQFPDRRLLPTQKT